MRTVLIALALLLAATIPVEAQRGPHRKIFSSSTPAVISYVDTESGICVGTGVAVACEVDTVNAVGDILVATCFGTANYVCKPTDSNSETWVTISSGIAVGGSGDTATQSYTIVTVPGTDLINPGGGTGINNRNAGLIIEGWNSSTGWKASPVDTHSTANSSAGTACSATFSGASSQANELIYAACGSASDLITDAAGFVARIDNGDVCNTSGNVADCATFDQIITSTGTPSFVTNDLGATANAAFITGFKPN